MLTKKKSVKKISPPSPSLPTQITLPTTAVIFFAVLLMSVSAAAGYFWVKVKNSSTTATLTSTSTAAATFAAKTTKNPSFKFFVMSFCPYGNQMEDTLRPVFNLLGKKVDLEPHYIFEKITDLQASCKQQTPDPANCSQYITSPNAPFKTIDDCKKYIADMSQKCLDESQYIKSDSGALYASLHGRQEANQDVREICAYNMASDKSQFWNFIGNVNKNCTAQNADSCWSDQAQKTGFDSNKITECFNKEGINLIEKEIALTSKFSVSGSPTLIINDQNFPPEAAYTQDGKGSLAIGKKVFTQDQYRTPEAIKTAICSSFSSQPQECKTALSSTTGANTAAANGAGCGQ